MSKLQFPDREDLQTEIETPHLKLKPSSKPFLFSLCAHAWYAKSRSFLYGLSLTCRKWSHISVLLADVVGDVVVPLLLQPLADELLRVLVDDGRAAVGGAPCSRRRPSETSARGYRGACRSASTGTPRRELAPCPPAPRPISAEAQTERESIYETFGGLCVAFGFVYPARGRFLASERWKTVAGQSIAASVDSFPLKYTPTVSWSQHAKRKDDTMLVRCNRMCRRTTRGKSEPTPLWWSKIVFGLCFDT